MFISCTSIDDNEHELSACEYNQKIIEYLRDKYNVNVKVVFSPSYKQRLSKDDVESFDGYFKFVGELKKCPVKMVLANKSAETRATKTCSQQLTYNGDLINVVVYYDIDTQNGGLASPSDVQVGMGGGGECFGHHYATIECTYSVEFLGSKFTVSNTQIDVESIKGDYILYHYNIKNGRRENTWYAKTQTKLSAWGYVDVKNNSCQFQLEYAGEGSWMDIVIDEGLHKKRI